MPTKNLGWGPWLVEDQDGSGETSREQLGATVCLEGKGWVAESPTRRLLQIGQV